MPEGDRSDILQAIDRGRVPVHVGCVMDGNGRWATQRGLPRIEGHAAGEASLMDAVEGGLELGIGWLTVYAFSTENWRRPADEVRFLMGFNESLLTRRRDELHEKGVRIRFAGRRDWRVPKRVLKRMDESSALTGWEPEDDSHHRVQLRRTGRARGRGARTRRVRAHAPRRSTRRSIHAHLYHPDQPDPDLVIRTSGEHRMSNFLLWQIAYSELVFTDVLWPDFRREDLYRSRGGVPATRTPIRGREAMTIGSSRSCSGCSCSRERSFSQSPEHRARTRTRWARSHFLPASSPWS